MNTSGEAINLKNHYRRPKQARSKMKFEAMLDCAEQLIESGRLESFTLADIVETLGVTVGAVYHFFPSKDALLVAVTDRALDAFTNMGARSDTADVKSWTDIVERTSIDGRDHYLNNPAIMTLILGPGYIWPVRLSDSAGNERVAASLAASLRSTFDLSFIENLEDLMLDIIVIQDAIWRRSYELHRTITDDYFEKGLAAWKAYCRNHIPDQLRGLSSDPESFAPSQEKNAC